MKEISVVGIDLAKSVFQIHAIDARGKVVVRRKMSRNQMLEFVVNLPVCTVAMEACGSAHHWGRKFSKLGHTVRLIAPQYVKPFVKTNKDDAADAEAIVEACLRPNMRFVAIKSVEQQEIQFVHRFRSRMVRHRTMIANEIRGLLREFGIVLQPSTAKIRSQVPQILEDTNGEMGDLGRSLLSDLYRDFKEMDARILQEDQRLGEISKFEGCKKLMSVPCDLEGQGRRQV